MMCKGALRSDREREAFRDLIETLGDENVDRAADDSRSRRKLQQQLKAATQKAADGPASPAEFMASDLAADIQKHLEREFDLG